MKEKLKYVVGILLACSLGIGFMPLIEISIIRLSVMDILKIGVGNYGDTELVREVLELFREYLRPGVVMVIVFIMLILAGAFVTVVIDESKAYVAALISAVVNNVLAVVLCVSVRGKIDEVENAFAFFGISSGIHFYTLTIILWVILYLIIVGLSVYGVMLLRGGGSKEPIIMDDGWRSSKEDYLERIERLERERKEVRKEADGISGIIQKRSGSQVLKEYPLQEKQPVYFSRNATEILITESRQAETLAAVYYISEHGEYCVEPYERMSFFLISGQPLGKDRSYRLSRGTEVYIIDRHSTFVLV